jgi:hypothetical protein
METATATDKVVAPGTQKYHPGMAKAWVQFSVSGTTPTINASYNVDAVVRTGVGLYRVDFTVPFSSANYAFLAMSGNAGLGAVRQSSGGTLAASFIAEFLNNSGGALTEPAIASLAFFGDQ